MKKIFNDDDYNYGDYITMIGVVSENDYEITEAYVESDGSSSEKLYNSMDAEYQEILAERARKAEEDFRNGDLETPSYNDLLRYSESYKEKKIKITVYISEVEPDGLLLPGTIWGYYQNAQITVSDDRVNKEPKILTGDTLTIYGYGGGTSVIKTYKQGTGLFGSSLGAEVVSETEVPRISVVYCDIK